MTSPCFRPKSDPDDPVVNKSKKEMNQKKSFLVEALARMAMAYIELDMDSAKVKFDELFTRLKACVDFETEKQYFSIYMEREKRDRRYGSLIKAINKVLGKEIKEKGFMYPLNKSKLMEERAAALSMLRFNELTATIRSVWFHAPAHTACFDYALLASFRNENRYRSTVIVIY